MSRFSVICFQQRQIQAPASHPAASTLSTHSGLLRLSDIETAAVIGGSLAADAADTNPPDPPERQSPSSAPGHWSESLQTILDQPPSSLPLKMIMGAVAFTSIVGVWSWFGTIEEVSFAQGQLEPLGDVYKLQSPITGEVDEILVQEGDYVQRGQTIAATDRQLIEKEIQRLTQSLQADREKLAQTQSLIQQNRAELNTVQAMTSAEIIARKSNIQQAKDVIQTSERLLDQLQLDRQAQSDRLERLSELVERGALAEDQLFSIEQNLRDRNLAIIETEGGIHESYETITQYRAEMAQAQAMAQKQVLETTQNLQELQITATDLASSIQETETLLEQTKAQMDQAVIAAPVSGIISTLEVTNVGEVVQPGQTIAEIAPQEAPLVLSAMLPNQEAGLVDIGMPANMKFDAFPYQDYGIVTGEILAISPDAKLDEKNGAVYHIKIELDADQVEHEGEQIPLRAGQTATAEIVVRQRRIISLVLDPIRKLQKSNISL